MDKFLQTFTELSARNTIMSGYYSLNIFIFSKGAVHIHICCGMLISRYL